MGRHARKQFDSDNFLTTEHQSIWVRWPGQVLAIVATVVLVVTGVQYAERWTSARPQSSDATVVASAPELTSADVVARHAVAAFGDSAVGTDASLTPVQRAVGMPNDPVAGLTRDTAAGPVQIVLPGGLGPAQATVDGHVVYPNRGAGFDFLAENTGSGTRTIARIPDPSGPRAVTTFVRTPADTVMLAHTNGYLTINRATPTADTVALFSPAETRDATGTLVPSSYVVRQLRPGLYQMTEVIDPTPETVFPVFVDPPLHTGSPGGPPLPAGFLDTLSGAVDAVGGAITTAANATVSGVTAVGTFVKENPLESAILVGGVALAITGVGGPAGAAAIASVTVNLASAGVDIAAAAMPDNQALGFASDALGMASMVTPQGAAKKVATEGLETLAGQALHNADKVIDVAKTTPTPPAQLADQITGAAGKGMLPGAGTPKAPNAPPTAGGTPPGGTIPPALPPAGGKLPPGHGPDGPRSLPTGCTLDCGHQTPAPAGVYSETEIPGHYNANLDSIQGGKPNLLDRVLSKKDIQRNRREAQRGLPRGVERIGRAWHEFPHASAQQGGRGADTYDLPLSESNIEGQILSDLYARQGVKPGDQYTTVYRGDDALTRCSSCAIDRRNTSSEPPTAAERNRAATTALKEAQNTWNDPETQTTDSQQNKNSGGLNSSSNENSGSRKSSNDGGNKSGKKDQKKSEKKKKRETQAQKKRKKKDGR
ncbi:hypothetical protein BVC93_11850 [Mycobacterium sp. MS1601]|uniref:NucA/NucB deoxyribonuclease domain-containing protein n=1 Tax=Mycobacterium sp. MS1601 TaxID=1936029 RepID=UPI000979659D|nr:NucA/NucB deoxyribonuclease domain-containing protein [Mycobacterium sp. MS1601]AQA03012.1 hypothetical protein BVC93_11850 [Mycobacterium sp. MS1601]